MLKLPKGSALIEVAPLAWSIRFELSYGGTVIHDNTLTDNGLGDGTPKLVQQRVTPRPCSDGSVRAGVEIYGNTIDGAAYPLGLINHSGHPTRTRQVYVYDNVMTLRAPTSRVGAVAFNGLTELLSAAAGNRWNVQTLTWARWKAFGHDVGGTVELVTWSNAQRLRRLR